MMPSCTIKDLLESPKNTTTWAPVLVRVKRAPKTAVTTQGAKGEDWTRVGLDVVDDSTHEGMELVWTDPPEPWLSNPSSLTGQTISVLQGAKTECYKGKWRLKTRGNKAEVITGGVAPRPGLPSPSAGSPATEAPKPSGRPSQITDRAILQAVSAWAPKVKAALAVPGEEGNAQAVSSFLSTMVIAAMRGELAITLYEED